MVDGLCAALDGAFTAGASSARRVRAEGRAVRVASAAVAYLEAARGRAVFSHEIGAAIGVSPRFVNQCFDAVFGMSVHRYLRLRRLAEARRRLMAGGDGLLVKQVALDLGLWHFGRFASAYQAQFGETPSQTLAAGGRRPHR
ncbi:AraC family transcriptional regulator [Roseomonas oryzicola]|uniref:AraC family transcriptional regulator n=1 Tax=Neoroseomonas oryzicola TaxID=535904 RepID=A0ABX1EP38_9PROT|nr:AraC family transcriptional regulator [Neoroseomonas oryzicola]